MKGIIVCVAVMIVAMALPARAATCPQPLIKAQDTTITQGYADMAARMKSPCLVRLESSVDGSAMEFVPEGQTGDTWTSKVTVMIVPVAKGRTAVKEVDGYLDQIKESARKTGQSAHDITKADAGVHGKVIATRFGKGSGKDDRIVIVRTVAKDKLAAIQLLTHGQKIDSSVENIFLSANGLR